MRASTVHSKQHWQSLKELLDPELLGLPDDGFELLGVLDDGLLDEGIELLGTLELDDDGLELLDEIDDELGTDELDEELGFELEDELGTDELEELVTTQQQGCPLMNTFLPKSMCQELHHNLLGS